MNPEFVSRLIITVLLSGTGVIVFLLVNKWILIRATSKIRKFENYRVGYPAIVYFTLPDCVPCKTFQRPALEKLKNRLGDDLQVIEVDASLQPEVAQDWGVLSVPTTFVIDTDGNPRHVNHGIVSAEKLDSQLEDFEI